MKQKGITIREALLGINEDYFKKRDLENLEKEYQEKLKSIEEKYSKE